MRCVASAVALRSERQLASARDELVSSQAALWSSSERISQLVAEVQSIKDSVQLEVRQLYDGVTATYAARNSELLRRVQQVEFDLRARPLIKDGWTRDPAGDAGPCPPQAVWDALAIAKQDLENWMEDSCCWQARAESAEGRLVSLSLS